ncbi:MAG TPA: hypothetical protein VMT52_00415 [Planctomycetota bacterium]|nr:hypothetical protein [Planctomycetota bacterium]
MDFHVSAGRGEEDQVTDGGQRTKWWDRARGWIRARRKAVRGPDPAEGPGAMARIRVYAHTRDGERVPMVGLVSRQSLDDMRDLFEEAGAPAGQHRRLGARLKELDLVQVETADGTEKLHGRKVLLGLRIVEEKSKASRFQDGIEELILESREAASPPAEPTVMAENK